MNDFMDKQTLILKTQIELSTHRVKVLKSFDAVNRIRPTQISELTGIHINNVSKSLGQLRNMGLVKMVGSKGRARYYKLTDDGKYMLDFLD